MSSGHDSIIACPRCQAKVFAKANACWQCGSAVSFQSASPKPALSSEYVSDSKTGGGSSTFGIASLFLVITLIAVCLGLFVAAPGAGVLLGVFSIPPLIRTLMVVNQKKTQGLSVDPGNKLALFLASFGVTVIITSVTLGVSTLVFCGSCLSLLAISQGGQTFSEEAILPIACLFTLASVVAMIWLFSYWIRVRWWQDTKLP